MSNNYYRPGGFNILPPVVKNLLIINGLAFLANISLVRIGTIDLNDVLGLHYVGSEKFQPYQFLTYMFMHSGWTHILFNMFALWMFGNAIENLWGPKRFLIYYFATGLGAAVLHQAVQFIEIHTITSHLISIGMNTDTINDMITSGNYNPNILEFISKEKLLTLYGAYNFPTVGASGSVFGLLLAFGMMFPNTLLYVYFAIPVKAKWFVLIYGAIELYLGMKGSPGDNVAHFAHLGGMIFGFIMIKLWKKKDTNKWIS